MQQDNHIAHDDLKHHFKDISASVIEHVHESEAQHENDVKRPLLQTAAANGSSESLARLSLLIF